MTIYKFLALGFIFLTLAFSYVIWAVFRLRRYGLNPLDLSLPLYAIEIVLVSGYFFTHSYLAIYAFLMALLAMIVTFHQLMKKKQFTYRRFFKLYWRLGFFVTFATYLFTVLAVFILT